MLELNPSDRRALRARAHKLHPVVSVGQHGLTPAVLHEIDVNLKAHELIKVRVFDDDRDARESLLSRICTELDAAPVQHIGKLLVLWRPKPPEAVEAAKSTPQVRRPRTPLPRSPARPPSAPGGRARRPPATPAGGRRRRPHP
jgi:putative YhbY family RNA-binding protein